MLSPATDTIKKGNTSRHRAWEESGLTEEYGYNPWEETWREDKQACGTRTTTSVEAFIIKPSRGIMMSKITVWMVVGLVSVLLTSCGGTSQTVEELYKKACNEFYKELGRELKKSESWANRNSDTWFTDVKEKGFNAAPKKDALTVLLKKLNRLISTYPSSEWADDAQLLKAVLLDSDPERQIAEYQKFVKNYPDAKLEDWTINNGKFWCPSHIKEITPVRYAQSQIAFIYKDSLKDYAQAINEYSNLIESYEREPKLADIAIGELVLTYHYLKECYEELEETAKIRAISDKIEKRKEEIRSRGEKGETAKSSPQI